MGLPPAEKTVRPGSLSAVLLFYYRLPVVIQVRVKLNKGMTVGEGKYDYTVTVRADIQRSKAALLKQALSLFQGGFHGKAEGKKLIPGGPPDTGKNLIGVNLIEIAFLYNLGLCQTFGLQHGNKLLGQAAAGQLLLMFFQKTV